MMTSQDAIELWLRFTRAIWEADARWACQHAVPRTIPGTAELNKAEAEEALVFLDRWRATLEGPLPFVVPPGTKPAEKAVPAGQRPLALRLYGYLHGDRIELVATWPASEGQATVHDPHAPPPGLQKVWEEPEKYSQPPQQPVPESAPQDLAPWTEDDERAARANMLRLLEDAATHRAAYYDGTDVVKVPAAPIWRGRWDRGQVDAPIGFTLQTVEQVILGRGPGLRQTLRIWDHWGWLMHKPGSLLKSSKLEASAVRLVMVQAVVRDLLITDPVTPENKNPI